MQAVAELFDDESIVQEIGTAEATEGTLFVRTRTGRLRADVAVSCLVAPCSGDRVMVGVTGSGRAFVLAVLQRPTDTPPRIRVEGDLRIAAGGRISFIAKEGVDIATENDVNIVSERLDVHAKQSQLVIDSLAFLGRFVRVDADRVKSVVGLLDQVAERFSLKAKRSYRFVEEVDVHRAAQIDIRADENVAIRGRNAVVNAEQLVKVDGRQIHLG
jgi:hypothetical protein